MAKLSIEQAMQRARSHLRRGETAAARAIYREIVSAFPGNSRAREALAALGPGDEGAARHNPPSERMAELVGLYETGNHSAAVELAQGLSAAFPASFDVWNIGAASALRLGRLDQAEAAFARAAALDPNSPETRNNLGVTLLRTGRAGLAADCFLEAIRLAPDYGEAHFNLGTALASLARHEEAEASFQRALELAPDHADAHNNFATLLKDMGRAEEAVGHYEKALSLRPDQPDILSNLGNVLRDVGRVDDAVAAYERAIAVQPDHAASHRHLSAVKRYAEDDAQYRAMRALHSDGALDDAGRSHLAFALAKALEDMGRVDEAFAFLSEGNALRRRVLGYDPQSDVQLFAGIRSAYRADLMLDPATLEPAPAIPIFVLGMPRSGTSLIEQILASHSAIEGAGELPFLERMLTRRVAEGRKVDGNFMKVVRAEYLARVAPLAGGRPFVTDKMPNNFRWIGFIRAALPEARIVHVRRDARATCWSNFRHYFSANGLGYCYDLADTAAYYGLYRDIMAFWRETLPGAVHDLDYERLVDDQEGETRRLLDHIGLPFEESCLDFQNTRRSVRTASREQVRRAIYKGSSAEWLKYAHLIGDAFDGLPA